MVRVIPNNTSKAARMGDRVNPAIKVQLIGFTSHGLNFSGELREIEVVGIIPRGCVLSPHRACVGKIWAI